MNKSESIANLAKALSQFQGKVSAVKKDAINPFFKSKYATLDNIIETAKPVLAEFGLSYCQLPHGDESLTTIIMHESGEFIESTCNIHAAKKDPQGLGSAITYFRRYALAAALGMCSDEDDDGNATVSNQPPQQATIPPKGILPDKPKSTLSEKAFRKLCERVAKGELGLAAKADEQFALNEMQTQELDEAYKFAIESQSEPVDL